MSGRLAAVPAGDPFAVEMETGISLSGTVLHRSGGGIVLEIDTFDRARWSSRGGLLRTVDRSGTHAPAQAYLDTSFLAWGVPPDTFAALKARLRPWWSKHFAPPS